MTEVTECLRCGLPIEATLDQLVWDVGWAERRISGGIVRLRMKKLGVEIARELEGRSEELGYAGEGVDVVCVNCQAEMLGLEDAVDHSGAGGLTVAWRVPARYVSSDGKTETLAACSDSVVVSDAVWARCEGG